MPLIAWVKGPGLGARLRLLRSSVASNLFKHLLHAAPKRVRVVKDPLVRSVAGARPWELGRVALPPLEARLSHHVHEVLRLARVYRPRPRLLQLVVAPTA